MKMVQNWDSLFVLDDTYRSCWKKSDLVYLLNKYGRKVNNNPPSKTELNQLKQSQLNIIWHKIKPLEFGGTIQ